MFLQPVIVQEHSEQMLPREGGKWRRDGWRRVVLTWGFQKTLNLTTRQHISTHVVNTCNVRDVEVEIVCGCNEQQCANEIADVW